MKILDGNTFVSFHKLMTAPEFDPGQQVLMERQEHHQTVLAWAFLLAWLGTLTDAFAGEVWVTAWLRNYNTPVRGNYYGNAVKVDGRGDGVQVSLSGTPGVACRIQRSESLTSPFTTVGKATIGTEGRGKFTDPSPAAVGAFYRAVYP